MDSAETIVQTILTLSAHLTRESDQILRERIGIGLSQYKILLAVAHNERLQQRSIALELGQTEASVTRQIKLLIAQGMITVRTNPANRREHFSELTAKGVRVSEAGRQSLAQYYRDATSRLSTRQQEIASQLLTELQR
ncbi:MAG TPA: MarR family transcriptional regulator [Candidatus Saccharimonadales bacterium]|nr:MarR family transcriptional regulator [Candidatus Saccharimonadales bacterium]